MWKSKLPFVYRLFPDAKWQNSENRNEIWPWNIVRIKTDLELGNGHSLRKPDYEVSLERYSAFCGRQGECSHELACVAKS